VRALVYGSTMRMCIWKMLRPIRRYKIEECLLETDKNAPSFLPNLLNACSLPENVFSRLGPHPEYVFCRCDDLYLSTFCFNIPILYIQPLHRSFACLPKVLPHIKFYGILSLKNYTLFFLVLHSNFAVY